MNKELIANAHELWAAAQLTPGEGIEDGVDRVAAILAAIDAERGKDAKAFLITGTQLGMPYTDVTQRKEVIDRAHSLGYEVSPLFLSPTPTIPEGVAMVPIEPTDEMLKAADEGDREYTTRNFGADMPTVAQGAYDHYHAMIAAAQGECNAD